MAKLQAEQRPCQSLFVILMSDPKSPKSPAPPPPYRGQLSALTGGTPNGTWRLFPHNSETFGAGAVIAGGWVINLVTE